MTNDPQEQGAMFVPSAPGAPGVRPAAPAPSHALALEGRSPLDPQEQVLVAAAVLGVVVCGGFAVGAVLASFEFMGGTAEPMSPVVALGLGIIVAAILPPTLLIVGGLAWGAGLGTRAFLRRVRLSTLNRWTDPSTDLVRTILCGVVIGGAVTTAAFLGMLTAYDRAGASTEEFAVGGYALAVLTGTVATFLVVRTPRYAATLAGLAASAGIASYLLAFV